MISYLITKIIGVDVALLVSDDLRICVFSEQLASIYLPSSPHCATTQNNFDISTAVKTSNNICWRTQIMELSVIQFSPTFCYFPSLIQVIYCEYFKKTNPQFNVLLMTYLLNTP
jgi:hypothetical protein